MPRYENVRDRCMWLMIIRLVIFIFHTNLASTLSNVVQKKQHKNKSGLFFVVFFFFSGPRGSNLPQGLYKCSAVLAVIISAAVWLCTFNK